MNKHRLLVVIVFMLVLGFVFAGCQPKVDTATNTTNPPAASNATAAPTTPAAEVSNFNTSGWPVVKEKVELDVFGSRSANSPEDWNDYTIFKTMEQVTNVHINWNLVVSSSYTDKRSIMLASGDYPDVIATGVSVTELIRYGSEGVFIPTQDLIAQYCPQLTSLFDEQAGLRAINTMPDGNMYSFPFLSDGPWTGINRVMAINTDWLKKLNLTMPTNLEEFEKVLIAFRDQDPNGNGQKDEIPLSWAGALNNKHTSGWGFGLDFLSASFQAPDPGSHLDVVNNKIEFVPAREQYRDWVNWLSKLNSEKLLDPLGFTQGTDQYAAKINTLPYSIGVVAVWDIGDTFTDPKAYDVYDYMPPLKGLNNEDPTVYLANMSGSSGKWVITSACENPEIAARLGDYFYDKDVSLEMFEGAIGERLIPCTVENNGRALMVGPAPAGMDNTTYRDSCGPGGAVPLGVTRAYYQERLHLHYTDRKVKFINDVLRATADKDPAPTVMNYTLAESDIVNQIQTEIIEFANRRAAEWVLDGKVMDEWDAYISELDKMRLGEWMKAAQSAYERFVESNK